MTEVVETGSRVLAHFTVHLDDGSVADSSKVLGKPAWFVLGDGSLAPELETALLGLGRTDVVKVTLPGHKVFGDYNPDNLHFMDISDFPRDVDLKVGAIVAFEQINGDALPGLIRDIKGHSVQVDFNHPLSDKNITLELEVVEIKPQTAADGR